MPTGYFETSETGLLLLFRHLLNHDGYRDCVSSLRGPLLLLLRLTSLNIRQDQLEVELWTKLGSEIDVDASI